MNDFLKKTLPVLCAAMPLFSMAADSVPAVWTRRGTVNKAGQLRAIGIKLDNEQITFAFADWDKASGDSISVYWNSDNDKSTGRFKNNYGSDIQFNITPGRNSVSAICWRGERERTDLKVNAGNSSVSFNDNVLSVR